MFSRATYGLLSFNIRRGIVGNGLALPTELHSHRLWQDSNLRPSKEPSHITTRELIVQLIAEEWATRYRHFLPAADRSRTAPK
jgi:hypothetical protein